MKLIHCADLHLDSPMESNLPSSKARERKNEILSTFSKLVSLADENGASAILIVGDLFDSSRASRKTQNYVLDLIAEHENLYFFYLAGNHDGGSELFSGAELPENLKLFGSDWTTYDFGDVIIAGSESPDPELLSLSPDRLNIVLLHGQARDGGTADADTIPFRRYRDKHIDYMALGHLHAYREAKLDERGIACYSGCLEGRGFDECGAKGYVLLEINNGKLSHTFIPMARRTLHEVEVDLTDLHTQRETEAKVLSSVAGIPQKDLVKVRLTGDRPADELLDISRIVGLLSDKFYFAKVKNEMHIKINPNDYLGDISLKGEFVRRVSESGLSQAEKDKILACGFRALSGEELDI